jgi:hypothetical protein
VRCQTGVPNAGCDAPTVRPSMNDETYPGSTLPLGQPAACWPCAVISRTHSHLKPIRLMSSGVARRSGGRPAALRGGCLAAQFSQSMDYLRR